ncbi:uncharacterized protein E5676_scaffold749G00180 [Cucumis melo var. makuwa]|uniref:Uncharacterized protein n=1 Tax=Cucumis melo var. makuwa TaxID=1194695 RepID=A0A5D3DVG3_CUCMM|nr:uncharacterized protein E5676_scaffold749G00180 [Cucumis melo var. makuwa]
MRGHKEKHVETEVVLRHPVDAEGCGFPNFASDSWNVCLGLGSDEFNPFGHMSTSYNMWPVVLIPYNLLPLKCMKSQIS